MQDDVRIATEVYARVRPMDDYYDNDPCPCDSCSHRDYCDGWEAHFCCTLCQWHGMTDCENCDPMDI